MRKDLTELVFILDRSGSMGGLEDDTIGGFNRMISHQKKEDGQAYVTTVLFDHMYEMLHNRIPIGDVQPLTTNEYYARGTTALLDALGTTIELVGRRLSAMPEEERPGKVIFVITTDGLENASQRFTKPQIREMIEHQQNKYSWNFIFLGANMDAVGEADQFGISPDFARSYLACGVGTEAMFDSIDETVACMRDPEFDRNQKNDQYQKVMGALDKAETEPER